MNHWNRVGVEIGIGIDNLQPWLEFLLFCICVCVFVFVCLFVHCLLACLLACFLAWLCFISIIEPYLVRSYISRRHDSLAFISERLADV